MSDASEEIVLGDGRHLRLVSRDGWEYADRPKVGGIVVVLAVTDDNKVVLIEQHRPAVRANVIELPAGLAGDTPGSENETLETAAQRELEEETGYTAARMFRLTEGPPSPGMSTEIITLFHAQELTKTGEGGGVAGEEDIQVHLVPLTDAHDWLDARANGGVMIDPKVYSGLYFAQR
jgi:ADP-ribose pyrophosphatase